MQARCSTSAHQQTCAKPPMCGLSADSSGGRTARKRNLAPEGRIAPLCRADGRGRGRGLGFRDRLCATRQTNAGNMRLRHSARVHRRDGGVRAAWPASIEIRGWAHAQAAMKPASQQSDRRAGGPAALTTRPPPPWQAPSTSAPPAVPCEPCEPKLWCLRTSHA